MTTYYPMIGLVTAAHHEVASQVFSVMPEWGPGTFGIQLAPTALGPATHYAFGNGSSTYDDSLTVLAMLDGTLPELYGDPVPWGEEGWPEEVDALAAVAPTQLQIRVYGGNDGLTPLQRFNNWMAELELVRVEDPI